MRGPGQQVRTYIYIYIYIYIYMCDFIYSLYCSFLIHIPSLLTSVIFWLHYYLNISILSSIPETCIIIYLSHHYGINVHYPSTLSHITLRLLTNINMTLYHTFILFIYFVHHFYIYYFYLHNNIFIICYCSFCVVIIFIIHYRSL